MSKEIGITILEDPTTTTILTTVTFYTTLDSIGSLLPRATSEAYIALVDVQKRASGFEFAQSSNGSFASSTGLICAVVIPIAIVVITAISLGVWLFKRTRKEKSEKQYAGYKDQFENGCDLSSTTDECAYELKKKVELNTSWTSKVANRASQLFGGYRETVNDDFFNRTDFFETDELSLSTGDRTIESYLPLKKMTLTLRLDKKRNQMEVMSPKPLKALDNLKRQNELTKQSVVVKI